MYRRATALAVLALAGMPGVAAAATEVNVIPHGQQQPGVPWASVPGMLPADAQARMYDRLTPFGADVTDAMLRPSADGRGFFKSAALRPVDDPSFLTDETVTATAGGRTLTARIRRDAYGVPHVYSDTDDGVIFGAGYALAADRNLLLDQARNNGMAGAIGPARAAGARSRTRCSSTRHATGSASAPAPGCTRTCASATIRRRRPPRGARRP